MNQHLKCPLLTAAAGRLDPTEATWGISSIGNRGGASNARSDHEGDGNMDYLVASSRDSGCDGSDDATVDGDG